MAKKKPQPNQSCSPFLCIVPSCGMNGGIRVTLYLIQKNCCLSNSKFVCCGDIAQLLVFNCFLRKEKKKRTKIFLTSRLVQTYLQINAAFLTVLLCYFPMTLVVIILKLPVSFFTYCQKCHPQSRVSCLIHFNMLFCLNPWQKEIYLKICYCGVE